MLYISGCSLERHYPIVSVSCSKGYRVLSETVLLTWPREKSLHLFYISITCLYDQRVCMLHSGMVLVRSTPGISISLKSHFFPVASCVPMKVQNFFTFPYRAASHVFHISFLHCSVHHEYPEVQSHLPEHLLSPIPYPLLPPEWSRVCQLASHSHIFRTWWEIFNKINSRADPVPGTRDLYFKV